MYNRNRKFTAIPTLNLAKVLEKNDVPAKWYWNHPTHPNHKVFKIWAEEISRFIPKHLLANKTTEEINIDDIIYKGNDVSGVITARIAKECLTI